MRNSGQSPSPEDLAASMLQSPTDETDDTPPIELDGLLDQQDIIVLDQGSDSEESDADYIPPSLASFVKQAQATLESTREKFLSTAKAPAPEPSVFCFDNMGGRSTPPIEDEQDLKMQRELLERFRKPGDQRFDVGHILSHYSETNQNDTEEVLFSPDLRTPPPNPHYNISASEARQIALGTPSLTVDTHGLPIRPPRRRESASSSAMDDDEPMDAMAWLDSITCDQNVAAIIEEERKPDPPTQRTAEIPDPLPSVDSSFPGSLSFQLSMTPLAPQREPPNKPNQAPVAETTTTPDTPQVSHVGEIDETETELPPPSSPQGNDRASPMKSLAIKTVLRDETIPKEIESTVESSGVPMEVMVEFKPQETPKQKVDVQKTKPMQSISFVETTKAKTESPPKRLASSATRQTPTQTPAKRPAMTNTSKTTSSKKSLVSDRLSRPTTTSATRAAARRMTPGSSPKLAQSTPQTTATPPQIVSSVDKSSGSKSNADHPIQSTPKVRQTAHATAASPVSNGSAAPKKMYVQKGSVRVTSPVERTRVNLPKSNAARITASKPRASSGPPTPSAVGTDRPAEKKKVSQAKLDSGDKLNARVTRTFKQSKAQNSSVLSVDGSGGSREVQSKISSVSSRLLQGTTASEWRRSTVETHQSRPSKQNSSKTAISKRLLQETAASKQRHLASEVAASPVIPKSPSRNDIDASIPSRLLHETAASKFRLLAAEEEHSAKLQEKKSPSRDDPEPVISSRLLQETNSSKQRHAPVEPEVHVSPSSIPHLPGRLLQETTASMQRQLATMEHLLQTQSTPTKPIHGDEDKLLASREKAQERIRQRLLREKEKENAAKAGPRHDGFSPDEGVARARERLKQRQLKERQEGVAKGKENITKIAVRARRPSFVGIQPKDGRPLTIPQGPKLTTSRRPSLRNTAPPSFNSGDSAARRISESFANMTLAQSTDILRKGLRTDETSHSPNASARRILTIAQSPNFATSVRHGAKLSSVRWREEATLASSTRLLQSQLRGEDPSLARKRQLSLTVPKTPKFHAAARRTLPKSTAELEEEMMKELNSRPFKALSYRACPPKPVVLANRTVSRPVTAPKPFSLESDKRAASPPKRRIISLKESEDQAELKKKFHARPMPSFANPPQVKPARMTKADHQSASVTTDSVRASSPPNLRTSSRAEKRMETAQIFSSHAEQARVQKELEYKQRQHEKHLQEMRKAESLRGGKGFVNPRESVAPFTLSTQLRHEISQQKLQEKLLQQEEQQRKAASFHARQFRPSPPPEKIKATRPTTSPEPFRLVSNERHNAFEEKHRKQMEEAEEVVHRQSQFRARRVPQTTYSADTPSAQPFLLATTARLLAHQEEKKKREEAEYEEIQKMAHFKARPVPQSTYEYRPMSPNQPQPRGSPQKPRSPMNMSGPPVEIMFPSS